MIPYGRQDISQDDIDAVVRVLESDWLTQGPIVPAFEQAIASYCGARHGVAFSSATSGLHAACAVLGVGKGDIVWTAANTFVASANCALYCGATFDLVDVGLEDGNINVTDLESRLSKASSKGLLPKVVIPVHFAGEPCDMSAVYELSRTYGFKIIEDASHAIGAKYGEDQVGSCQYSDITIFSFHPVKVITSGEGGVATTNDSALAEKLRRFRSHGITRDPEFMHHASVGPWFYEQIELGYNYRMSDIHAALGSSQLRRLDEMISRRHELAISYDQAFVDLPVELPVRNNTGLSALHLYVIRLKLDEIKKTRLEVIKSLHSLGIGVNVHYIPLYYHPYYSGLDLRATEFPVAERRYRESVTLPLFPKMSETDQGKVIHALKEVLSA